MICPTRLERGRLRGPGYVGPPFPWQVIATCATSPGADPFSLVADVLPNHGLIAAYGRNQEPAGPKALAYEGLLPFAWTVLPISGMLELSGVLLFAANLLLTFLLGRSAFAHTHV